MSTSVPDGRIDFTADNPELVQRYRFGLKTADFLLCRNCGVYVGATIETGRGAYGIINVRALMTTSDKLAATEPIDYDAENVSDRVARREEHWTPVRKTA